MSGIYCSYLSYLNTVAALYVTYVVMKLQKLQVKMELKNELIFVAKNWKLCVVSHNPHFCGLVEDSLYSSHLHGY